MADNGSLIAWRLCTTMKASDVTATVLARKRAEYVSTLMEDTAAGSEQLSASVREISESMDKSREIANDAFDRVIHADQSTQRLDSAADQIGEVISLITGIAEQANLLALNATIEAARAGEAGKGFAVVAGEVKNLSNQTSKATEDIRGRIDNLRSEMDGIVTSMREGADAVAEGREVITGAGQEMRSMSEQVIGITLKMEEIAGILSQQTAASHEVAEGITAIAGMTANNVAQIESVVDFLAATDEELVAGLDDLLNQQIPDMTIYRAKSDHIIWKKKLAEMMVQKQDQALLAKAQKTVPKLNKVNWAANKRVENL